MQWNYRGGNIATSWQKLWRNRRQTGKTRASRSYCLKKKNKLQDKSSRGCPLSPAAPGDLAMLCFALTPALKNSAFHVSTATPSHSIKLRGARATLKLITYALATGRDGRSKTVSLPEFSIILLFPQQNLLLRAQQLPFVRAKGKNMRWLTKCGHKFKAEDKIFLCKKEAKSLFLHISMLIPHYAFSYTRLSTTILSPMRHS